MSYSNFNFFNAQNTSNDMLKGNDTGKLLMDVNNQSPVINVQKSVSASEENQVRKEVIQGKVTQLFSNFGYINDNVIFSKSDVVGAMVAVGDKVIVNATFQPNSSTKYKGDRVIKVEEIRDNSAATATALKSPIKANTIKQTVTPTRESVGQNRWDKTNATPVSAKVDNVRMNRKLTPTQNISVDLTANDGSNKDLRDDQGRNISVDLTKSDTGQSNTRSETIKSSLDKDKKMETNVRSNEKPNGRKETPRDKDKQAEKKQTEKRQSLSDALIKRSKATKRSEQARKSEAKKARAISPIRFESSPKHVSRERKSESRPKSLSKAYENFAYKELDCAGVRQQFRTLTLPDEFFHISLKYQQSFPLNHPMKLGNNCQFKVMDKRVKCIDPSTNVTLNRDVDPADADTTFVAKVMLLSTDDLAKFYKDTLKLAEEFDGENKIPITKAIKFLVGSVGQDKEFGIGGAWSPSLDGADPDTNPRVLINTAIRTCKAITGIDLSNCSSWSKFMELHYYRPMKKITKHQSLDGEVTVIDLEALEEPAQIQEPRVETVVYYVPDVWRCMPNAEEWNDIRRKYKEQLTCLMCPPPAMLPIKPPVTPVSHTDTTVKDSADAPKEAEDTIAVGVNDEEDYGEADPIPGDEAKVHPIDQPTHFSQLVITGMKIVEIKKELELRKLNNRGVMEQLKARLKAALDREELEERNKDGSSGTSTTAVTKPTSSILSEDQKNELKKLYLLQEKPEIIVHQNSKVICNDTKIRTMSLHSLLSYYDKKLEENTYELAIFAKQFLDMLRRDAVFNIYKSIVVASDTDLENIDESHKKGKSNVTTSKRTVNKQLLFSCCLLDREKSGKISLTDLKVLIEGLGICLSSNQLSTVLDKVKDSSNYLNYRQLTDKEMTENNMAIMSSLDDFEDIDYINELAMGNKALFDNEDVQMESLVDQEEVERLRNDLDKSGRVRQSMELKIWETKDATWKNHNLVHVQAMEIREMMEQISDYKSRYRTEQSRGDKYKVDYERLLGKVKDINKMTMGLSKTVGDSMVVTGDTAEETKNGTKKRSRSKEEEDGSGDKEVVVSSRRRKTSGGVVTNEEKTDGKKTESEDKDSKVVLGPEPGVVEDFELSVPSDYDSIVLE